MHKWGEKHDTASSSNLLARPFPCVPLNCPPLVRTLLLLKNLGCVLPCVSKGWFLFLRAPLQCLCSNFPCGFLGCWCFLVSSFESAMIAKFRSVWILMSHFLGCVLSCVLTWDSFCSWEHSPSPPCSTFPYGFLPCLNPPSNCPCYRSLGQFVYFWNISQVFDGIDDTKEFSVCDVTTGCLVRVPVVTKLPAHVCWCSQWHCLDSCSHLKLALAICTWGSTSPLSKACSVAHSPDRLIRARQSLLPLWLLQHAKETCDFVVGLCTMQELWEH